MHRRSLHPPRDALSGQFRQNRSRPSNPAPPRRQAGVALIIGLVMLLLVTIIGLAAMQTTNMEEHMAGNMQDRMAAFQAAEAALRAGESWVGAQTTEPDVVDTCSSAPCDVWTLDASGLGGLSDKSNSWWQSNGRGYGANLASTANEPRYVVEFQAYVPDSLGVGHSYTGSTGRNYYRITAHGTGGSDKARVVLKSTTTKRFN